MQCQVGVPIVLGIMTVTWQKKQNRSELSEDAYVKALRMNLQVGED